MKAHPDKNWDWYFISQNPNITMEMIEAHFDKPWEWEYVSSNQNLTMDFVEAHLDESWNWCAISRNPNLTMKFIKAHPELPWNWYGISCNPNITMNFIESHPDKNWDWCKICCNPNITMDFIERNMGFINWFYLSMNKFGWKQENTLQYYKQRKTQTIKQTKLIKEELIAKTWHPDRFMEWCVDNEELREIEETFGK